MRRERLLLTQIRTQVTTLKALLFGDVLRKSTSPSVSGLGGFFFVTNPAIILRKSAEGSQLKTTKFTLSVIVDSKDEKRHDVSIHAKDEHGRTLRMAGRTYDFTERHKAAEALIVEVVTKLITEGY